MATRVKTIEYAFPQYTTTVASATRYDFSEITLYIPETASRSFKSVVIEITSLDVATTATSLTAVLIGIKLGAAAFSDNTVTTTLTNSGEANSYIFQRDVTSYFETNFGTGSSQTCQVGVTHTGPSVNNITAKLIITYSYDDSSASTRIKTVRIPLDSGTDALTTSLASIGTNQVPALDTFLPESSKTYRCIWFEVEGNDGTNGTTDFYHAMALDSEAEAQDGIHEAGLNSARFFRRIWVRNDMTTNATHDLKMRVTGTAGGTCDHLAIVLCVTYEYDHANSTKILNSLKMPFNMLRGGNTGTSSANADRIDLEFYVQEANVSLKQSGVVLYYSLEANQTVYVSVGSQSFRSYTDVARTFCGGIALSHRFDSNGASGSGLSLARGKNTLTVRLYNSTTSNKAAGVGGFIYLNYESDKHSSGDGAHNHSVNFGLIDYAAYARVRTATVQPYIPETYWWLTSGGGVVYQNLNNTVTLTPSYAISAQYVSGEANGNGWVELDAGMGLSDTEAGIFVFCFNCVADFFRRHPNCPNTSKLLITNSRSWSLKETRNSVSMAQLWLTYHSITYTVSGTISGSVGGTVNLDLFHTGTDFKLATTSRTGNGSYSFTWYDNTENVFVVAYESDTKLGRSANGTAS